jgi:8-oxo-dGTP diphosphatase
VLQFEHTYPEKTILFDCWQVNEFQGKVTSCEGQPIKWVIKADLLDYDFPVANQRLIAQLL